jgi:hypothetical protein
MQNYKDLVLENEIGNMQIAQPIQDGTSKIDYYPLDVVEKLGKYQFIYDYSADNSNSSAFISKVNFSKGDVVEVVRFQLGSAMINNPNYKEYAPIDNTAPKTGFFSGLNVGELLKGLTVGNRKELEIPKEYLQKVDDSTSVTIPTGVNFGANPNSQPMNSKPIFIGSEPSADVILEENASFVLNQDYRYTKKTYCPPYARCVAPPQFTINSGTKVTGRLIRRNNNDSYTTPAGNITPNTYSTPFLEAKGVGVDGSINIPIEYLTRDVTNNTQNNNGAVVPVKNNNKNLLMIVGAFLVGYILFNKKTPSN